MGKMQAVRLQAQEVKPGDMLMVEDVIGGVEVGASYAFADRWALELPAMKQLMQLDRTQPVVVFRRAKD